MNIEILKKKELRANIIKALYSFYGEDISLAVLKASLPLSGIISEAQIKSSLYYLGGAEKRYIHLELNKADYMASIIWLTPKGVNLAEGDIQDLGVVVDE